MQILRKVSKDEFLNFLYDIDLTDKRFYDELNTNNYAGIFQFTGNSASKLINKIKPENFDELVAVNCLARPGTIEFAAQYLHNKEHPEHYPYNKQVCELLEGTHRTMLLQEQVMAIFNKIGGFSLEETNGIRSLMKALGKADKKPSDLKKWDEAVQRFTKNAIKKGLTEPEAKKTAEDLLAMSAYNFNKCFSGDCVINRTENNNFTIREMYLAKNDLEWAKRNNKRPLRSKYNREGYGKGLSLNNDNRIRSNQIANIYSQGIKPVYKITTENGKSIKVTRNHKILVLVDGVVMLKKIETGLSIGDILLTIGRRKKGEKGYPVDFSAIVSIEYIGEEDVYDVEMEAPYHTLCVNGIVASNSHAVAYTYNAIMTLYLSVYFRVYFYSALLSYEVERKGNVLEVLNIIKNKGVNILPPDINRSKETFSLNDSSSIIFGLQDIKFVGEKPTASIIENRPYKSLLDFILKTNGVNKKVLFSLIMIGCFDSIDKNRKKLLTIATRFYEEKKSIKVEEKLIAIYTKIEKEISLLNIQTEYNDLIQYERELLGFNFFNSVFSPKIQNVIKTLLSRKLIIEHFGEVDTVSSKVPILVKKIRAFNDKNGNPMAFLTIEDMRGESKSIPIFQSYWKYLNDIEEDEVYLMNFHLNEDNEIMFGSSRWIRDEKLIKRLVKKVS